MNVESQRERERKRERARESERERERESERGGGGGRERERERETKDDTGFTAVSPRATWRRAWKVHVQALFACTCAQEQR